jgi:voltage-gated potassium channel
MNATVRRLLISFFFVVLVILLGGLLLFALGAGRWRLTEALWMAVITVSTVGFGELHGLDQVPGARAVTVVIIMGGLGTVAYFQSAMTALIVEGVIGHAWRSNRMKKTIATLSGHVVVAGVGSTGRHVAEELAATKTPFVAIDRSQEVLERASMELMEGKMLYVHGDATEDHTLLDAGVARARGVVAALTHDRDNLFVTLSARALNATARLVTKVVEPEAVPKMLRAGANATVSPNVIGGRRLVSEMIRPEVVEFLDQMFKVERGLRFEEVVLADGSPLAGLMLRDTPIRKETNVLVVAIRDRDRQFQYNPGPDHPLQAGSVLVVLGEADDVAKLRRMAG